MENQDYIKMMIEFVKESSAGACLGLFIFLKFPYIYFGIGIPTEFQRNVILAFCITGGLTIVKILKKTWTYSSPKIEKFKRNKSNLKRKRNVIRLMPEEPKKVLRKFVESNQQSLLLGMREYNIILESDLKRESIIYYENVISPYPDTQVRCTVNELIWRSLVKNPEVLD